MLRLDVKEILIQLDYFGTILGILIGLIIIIGSLFNLIQQIYIGVSLLIIFGLNLFLRTRFIEKPVLYDTKIFNKYYLNVLFFIVYSVSIYDFVVNVYSRNLLYFILISFLAVFIFNDIFFSKISKNYILFKIFLLGVNIRYGFYYIFPSISGYDAYTHSTIIDYISNNGIVPPINISEKYFFYPIFHIYVALNKIFLNLSLKDTIFFSLGIVSIIITIFIFLIIRNLTNTKIALLSTLLFNITNININTYIGNITPASYLLIIFIIILYFLFNEKNNFKNSFIISLLLLISVLTHQLTTFVILLIISVLFLTNTFYIKFLEIKNSLNINLHQILFFVIFTYLYWNITFVNIGNTTFFDYIFDPFIETILSNTKYDFSVLTSGKLLINYSPTDYLILQVTYLILLVAAIGGALIWLKSQNGRKISISITFLILFAFIYCIPLLGFRNFLTDRWLPMLYLFAIPLSAVYLINLFSLLNNIKIKFLIYNLIIVIISILMVTSPLINKDNTFISKDSSIRNQFKLSEIQSILILDKYNIGNLALDLSFSDVYSYYTYINTHSYNNTFSNVYYFDGNFTTTYKTKIPNSLIVFRHSLLSEPAEIVNGESVQYFIFNEKIFNTLNMENKVYSSKNLAFYHG